MSWTGLACLQNMDKLYQRHKNNTCMFFFVIFQYYQSCFSLRHGGLLLYIFLTSRHSTALQRLIIYPYQSEIYVLVYGLKFAFEDVTSLIYVLVLVGGFRRANQVKYLHLGALGVYIFHHRSVYIINLFRLLNIAQNEPGGALVSLYSHHALFSIPITLVRSQTDVRYLSCWISGFPFFFFTLRLVDISRFLGAARFAGLIAIVNGTRSHSQFIQTILWALADWWGISRLLNVWFPFFVYVTWFLVTFRFDYLR